MQAVSSRVAEEMGVKLGEEVGYTIRFEDVSKNVRHFVIFLSFQQLRNCSICFLKGIIIIKCLCFIVTFYKIQWHRKLYS